MLGSSLFYGNSKTVTVKVPLGAMGYSPALSPFNGTSVTLSGYDTTVNWANGFRGGGWNGSGLIDSDYINWITTLNIVQQ